MIDEGIQEELVQKIMKARPLAAKLSKVLDGEDTTECIAALGIMLAMVTVDESEAKRQTSVSFFTVAMSSALMTFNEIKERMTKQ